MDLSELLAKHDQGDFSRGIAEAVLQLIMEADAESLIDAGCHERSGNRTTRRNGYRERALGNRSTEQCETLFARKAAQL
jgi:transposase-like protein